MWVQLNPWNTTLALLEPPRPSCHPKCHCFHSCGSSVEDHSVIELGDSQRMELDLISHPIQKLSQGQQDSSVGKGTCHQAWRPEFKLWVYTVEGENWHLQVVLWPLHASWGICTMSEASLFTWNAVSWNQTKTKRNSLGSSVAACIYSPRSQEAEAGLWQVWG